MHIMERDRGDPISDNISRLKKSHDPFFIGRLIDQSILECAFATEAAR